MSASAISAMVAKAGGARNDPMADDAQLHCLLTDPLVPVRFSDGTNEALSLPDTHGAMEGAATDVDPDEPLVRRGSGVALRGRRRPEMDAPALAGADRGEEALHVVNLGRGEVPGEDLLEVPAGREVLAREEEGRTSSRRAQTRPGTSTSMARRASIAASTSASRALADMQDFRDAARPTRKSTSGRTGWRSTSGCRTFNASAKRCSIIGVRALSTPAADGVCEDGGRCPCAGPSSTGAAATAGTPGSTRHCLSFGMAFREGRDPKPVEERVGQRVPPNERNAISPVPVDPFAKGISRTPVRGAFPHERAG